MHVAVGFLDAVLVQCFCPNTDNTKLKSAWGVLVYFRYSNTVQNNSPIHHRNGVMLAFVWSVLCMC